MDITVRQEALVQLTIALETGFLVQIPVIQQLKEQFLHRIVVMCLIGPGIEVISEAQGAEAIGELLMIPAGEFTRGYTLLRRLYSNGVP